MRRTRAPLVSCRLKVQRQDPERNARTVAFGGIASQDSPSLPKRVPGDSTASTTCRCVSVRMWRSAYLSVRRRCCQTSCQDHVD